MARTKYKELLRETIAEYNRMDNFVRIYPAFGSDVYDKYFETPRPFNRYIYRTLYTDYFGCNFSAPSTDSGPNHTWEKLKFGYKVKMPPDYIHKIQFKDPTKQLMDFEIKEETIQFYSKEPDDEDSPKK
jgi:hypothetical protein